MPPLARYATPVGAGKENDMERSTQDQGTGTVSRQAGNHMDACIAACSECHQVCLATIAHCLKMGGKHALPAHIRLLLDCAQICQTSADFMVRTSPHHGLTCGACAEICRACARSCRELDGPEMQRCAEVCARCADSCEEMASSARHATSD